MIAWDATNAEQNSAQKPAKPDAGGLLYQVTAAFPSWAGAILALYAILLSGVDLLRWGAFRIRPR